MVQHICNLLALSQNGDVLPCGTCSDHDLQGGRTRRPCIALIMKIDRLWHGWDGGWGARDHLDNEHLLELHISLNEERAHMEERQKSTWPD